jgi:hypothetical protein
MRAAGNRHPLVTQVPTDIAYHLWDSLTASQGPLDRPRAYEPSRPPRSLALSGARPMGSGPARWSRAGADQHRPRVEILSEC